MEELHNSNVFHSNENERKKVYPRKREATSSLSEDLKRYNDKVLLMHEIIQSEVFCPEYSVFESNSNLNDIEVSDTDINSNYSFSNCSTLSSVSQDDILKNIDINFEIGSKSSCCIKDTPSSSNSDLSVHSFSSASAGIQEDLDCLHLAEDDLSHDTLDSDTFVNPFVPSLFPKVPPTIYFGLAEEKIEPFPYEIRRLLKWKISSITPILLREIVERSGYQIVKEGDWLGIWDKHMKCHVFRTIKDYQKVNHFPGSFHLGRKDKMWQNYNEMNAKYGKKFSFIPETFIIPQDLRTLRKVWESDGPKKRWIIKPPASARGAGIKVINRWNQIPKKRPVVVQRYISDPYLINDSKFDLRLYVLVPSYDPLRIYVFNDGLVRFASIKYSTSVHSLGDRFMHLTNYSINKKSSTYTTSDDDENLCQGHKWTLKALQEYLKERDVNYIKIWEDIVDLIIKTIISSERPMNHLIKTHCKTKYNCFELFGFDIMIDKFMKSWLLEVNVTPSLHISSPLDFRIKKQVVKDMLNLVGYKIPYVIFKDLEVESVLTKYGIPSEEAENMCINKTLQNLYLSPDEKNKQSNFTSKVDAMDEDILQNLTPDDVRYLIESEDEFNRRGSFIRIFPSHITSKYLPFFSHSRYYNLLLDAWEQKYWNNKEEGIQLLQSLCQKSYHLQTVFKETPTVAENNLFNSEVTNQVYCNKMRDCGSLNLFD